MVDRSSHDAAPRPPILGEGCPSAPNPGGGLPPILGVLPFVLGSVMPPNVGGMGGANLRRFDLSTFGGVR